ncbi:MAG: endolytic transglycosylase MltG [Acidobacteria bacterium]|nr:endolytic transglycosylase MltG [Acidobacteriota bacterium]
MMRVLVLLLLAAAGGLVIYQTSSPHGQFAEPLLIEIERGSSTWSVAQQLASAGVVSRPEWFVVASVLVGRTHAARIQAGEYQFRQPATPLDVVRRLARGDVYLREVVIPEGSNRFDLVRILSAAGFRDPEPVLLKAPEGYLFPATYRYAKGTTTAQLLTQMETRFKQAWRQAAGTEQVKPDVVTLASLVEKEARVAEERPVIASVYANRLAKGIKLDCDPTVIYAALLEGKYRGTIYRSDLDREHPYNTYRLKGLPPGPIANPGVDSLRAALKPAATEYLFFVARPDGSGRHIFSKTIAEHNRAVADYRRGQQTPTTRSTPPSPSGKRNNAD